MIDVQSRGKDDCFGGGIFMLLAKSSHDRTQEPGVFYAVQEKHPMRVLVLTIDSNTQKAHASELFDAEAILAPAGMEDLAGVHYDVNTKNLLILSEDSRKVVRTNLTGEILDVFDVPEGIQLEGIAANSDMSQLYFVGEPAEIFIYSFVNNNNNAQFISCNDSAIQEMKEKSKDLTLSLGLSFVVVCLVVFVLLFNNNKFHRDKRVVKIGGVGAKAKAKAQGGGSSGNSSIPKFNSEDSSNGSETSEEDELMSLNKSPYKSDGGATVVPSFEYEMTPNKLGDIDAIEIELGDSTL
ncbi:hypothetical protein TL16_g05972 [Triparma laevis f. inornata]|uniref:Uncharacterized protein n=1 Tax=Triparma laevis f. inornata TaxID=1714386 RepID=A0A9W7ARK4_9STRA|nr:hypothetical protein TL16_g05972 [Triparma laevis f. inornata]